MPTLSELLDKILARALKDLSKSVVQDSAILDRINYICRCPGNRACVRLLMACMLAKLDRPEVDPRQPYTEIGGEHCFSGRTYDERYITHFINANKLPCNTTTAFLTPALRNINTPLTTEVAIVGRPPRAYAETIQILDDVAAGRVDAGDVLVDVVRILLVMREEKTARITTLLSGVYDGKDALPLASEAIVKLIEQHLASKNSSRLPVLVVAAAYKAAGRRIGEVVLPLQSHTAADEQTGAIGDVEVCLANEDDVVTAYEMKMKRVTIDDIDRALQKIVPRATPIDNYIFITTDVIDDQVREYAATIYDRTGTTEMAILDCIGFLRHFLHFFHRLRMEFLDAYQALVLDESESAVRQALKEAFLTLRQVAESDE